MRTFFQSTSSGRIASSSSGHRPRFFRPRLECLESRTLLSAGDLDPSFGTGGEVQTTFPPDTTAQAMAVAVQPDGKLVVGGPARVVGGPRGSGGGDVALVRYNPDGSPDPSFGTGGQVTTFVGGDSGGFGDLALQPDGKIVAAATSNSTIFLTQSTLVLFRYQPNGSLDPGFGTGGEVKLTDAGGSRVALQPDGKIVVAGNALVSGSSNQAETVARFNADGSVDQGFGTSGIVKNFGVSNGNTTGLALQADGKVLLLTIGSVISKITRLNADGSIDSLFGGRIDGPLGDAGQAVFGFTCNNLAVQPDGRIVVVGSTAPGGGGIFVAGRYNTNGTIDTTFGTGDQSSTDFGAGVSANAFGVAFQSDGRMVIAGVANGTTSSIAMIRYTPNGDLDGTFGTAGKVTTSFGVSGAGANAVTLQPDGKIVTAGFAQTGPNVQVFAVARYLPDTPIADPNQRFLTHVYLDLLGRLPDPGGLASWTGLLNQGVSRTQVVQMIEGSPEYHSVEVQSLYGFVLGRAADPTGQSIWGNFLTTGGTVEQLDAILLGTDEYFSGRGGGSNQSFLQAVYRDVLSRTLDAGGNQTWNQSLSAGASRTAVAAAILASPESDTDEVQALYARILRRSADSSGLKFFSNDLQQGVPNEAVLAALAGSDEYFART